MNVVILYDSKFGNTQHVADAIGAALRPTHSVELRTPTEGLPDPATIDVLFVGGPTHAHGASAPLKTTLDTLPKGSLARTRTVTFDTRFDMPRLLTGSAAASATKLLKRAGASVVAPPESFFVTRDNPPVLEAGELERAVGWAREVVG
jgi:flavodoxin